MSAKGVNLSRVGLVLVLLVGAVVACSPMDEEQAISVVINSPTSGSTVPLRQEVLIDSTVSASAGVDWVDLSVDGQVVRHDSSPEGNPAEFRVVQAWTPTAEGHATISVVAYDTEGAPDEVTITLQVVVSGGELPPTPTAGSGAPAAAVATPSETPLPPVTTEAGCTLDSQYVADVTIPDGTTMSPGEGFVKTWRVRNSGTCDWDAGFQLVHVSGEQMGAPASVSLPAVAAGTEVDVSASLEASSVYGTFEGTWRIRADDGAMFGTNLTVVIEVPSPFTETPTPSETPTEMPTDSPTTPPPLLTMPPPLPTPKPPPPMPPQFKIYGDDFHDCGGWSAITLLVDNTGSVRIEWAEVRIRKVGHPDLSWTLESDRPFQSDPAICGFNTGAESLAAGEQAYTVPLLPDFMSSGDDGKVKVILCTENAGDGLCAKRILDFTVP